MDVELIQQGYEKGFASLGNPLDRYIIKREIMHALNLTTQQSERRYRKGINKINFDHYFKIKDVFALYGLTKDEEIFGRP